LDELQQRLTAGDPVMPLDVRQPDEFTSPPGHLPSAVNVQLAELAGRTFDLARHRAWWSAKPIAARRVRPSS
jgi:hypothetical protein